MHADPEQFKSILAQWSTGVTVATTVAPDGVARHHSNVVRQRQP